ncbi:hypothetical protein NDU88_000960 [Pleurodeles waltl]|uniref:Uncharacterized protein n=1 Tax=Pleurodeles waltl TaxID=8319 RepID=A0AAV7NDF6_PLEWA|nr:hypothetical protein NDU88_000960 [Pleurodeles waltl]
MVSGVGPPPVRGQSSADPRAPGTPTHPLRSGAQRFLPSTSQGAEIQRAGLHASHLHGSHRLLAAHRQPGPRYPVPRAPGPPISPGARRPQSHPCPASPTSRAVTRRALSQACWWGATPLGAAPASSAGPRWLGLCWCSLHGTGCRAVSASGAVWSSGWCHPSTAAGTPSSGIRSPGIRGHEAPFESQLGRKAGSSVAVGLGG